MPLNLTNQPLQYFLLSLNGRIIWIINGLGGTVKLAVIILESELGEPGSNSERGCLHFISR